MNRKEKTIVVAAVANLVLVALKYALAAWSGSLALRASAWHSLADVFVSLFVLGGLFISRWEEGRLRSRAGRVENVVALAVSGFIFYVAYDIFQEVLVGREVPDLRNLWPVTAAALLTIAITYFTARYKEYVGRQTESPSLIASGYHSRMDLYASILVVVSLAVSALGLGALDRIAAAVIILFVILAGWEIASSALRALLTGGLPHLEEENLAQVRRHTRSLGRAAVGGLVVLFLLSGFYTVQPGEQAVVRRFGRVVAEAGPGLHYRMPLASRVDRVEVGRVRQVRTPTAPMLTGDTNLIEVGLNVHYTVADASAYLFSVNRPDELVAKEAEAAVRQAVAGRSVDGLLTVGRDEILEEAGARLQARLDGHAAGVRVTGLNLLEVRPPTSVAQAFRDVASAREDKTTYVNEAGAYQNEVVPVARGDAVKATTAARAERRRKTDRAAGEALRFASRADAYLAAPEITRTRLYLESMEQILPAVKKYILSPQVKVDSTDLWFGGGEAGGR